MGPQSSPAGCSEISDSDFCVLEDELDSGASQTTCLSRSEALLTSYHICGAWKQRASTSTCSRTPSASPATPARHPRACGRPSTRKTASRPSPLSTRRARRPTAVLASRTSTRSARVRGRGWAWGAEGLAGWRWAGGARARRGSWGAWRGRGTRTRRFASKSASSTASSPVRPTVLPSASERCSANSCVSSGLHASISVHICDDYLDQSTGQWVRCLLLLPLPAES